MIVVVVRLVGMTIVCRMCLLVPVKRQDLCVEGQDDLVTSSSTNKYLMGEPKKINLLNL